MQIRRGDYELGVDAPFRRLETAFTARAGSISEERRESLDPPVETDVSTSIPARRVTLRRLGEDSPYRKYQRRASTMISAGNRNPLNAELGTAGTGPAARCHPRSPRIHAVRQCNGAFSSTLIWVKRAVRPCRAARSGQCREHRVDPRVHPVAELTDLIAASPAVGFVSKSESSARVVSDLLGNERR